MLEILLLVFLCRKIGSMLRDKGRVAWPFQLLLVVCWIVGELAGMVIGIVLNNGEATMTAYMGAIAGAAVGATIVFLIANSMSPLIQHPMMAPNFSAFPVMPPGPPQGPPAPP